MLTGTVADDVAETLDELAALDVPVILDEDAALEVPMELELELDDPSELRLLEDIPSSA